MIIDGITLIDGEIHDAIIESATSLPTTVRMPGRLFYRIGGISGVAVDNGHPVQIPGLNATSGASSNGSIIYGINQDPNSQTNSHSLIWNGTTLIDIGTLYEIQATFITGISADGSVLIGECQDNDGSNTHAYRWTAVTGIVELTGEVSMNYCAANGMSADGTIVTGMFSVPSSGGKVFRWTAATGLVDLGALPDCPSTYNYYGSNQCISADGSTIIGFCLGANNSQPPFMWKESTGMIELTVPSGFSNVESFYMSANGSVLSGIITISSSGLNMPMRWTSASGYVNLGILTDTDVGYVNGTSSDGSILCGSCLSNSIDLMKAFRWTAIGGLEYLGVFPTFTSSYTQGISADGSIIVGGCYKGNDIDGYVTVNFAWTSTSGMIELPSFAGATETYANGISADGSTVYGIAIIGGAPIAIYWKLSAVSSGSSALFISDGTTWNQVYPPVYQ